MVAQSNCTVDSKATQGHPSPGSVAGSKKDSGSAHMVSGDVKEMLGESVERCGGSEERTGSCARVGAASVQGKPGGRTGEGKAACKVDGGKGVDGI